MRGRVDAIALICLTLLALPRPARLDAQRLTPTLDIGASSIRFGDTASISATTVTPGLRVESSSTTLAASLMHSQIASGGWTSQGAFAISGFVPLAGRLHGEIAATAGGSAHHDETRTGQMVAQARGHFIGRARGFWLGAGVGQAWDGIDRHRLTMLDAGAWVSSGSATLLASVAPTSLSDFDGGRLRYTDASVAARHVGPRSDIGAVIGARSEWGSSTAIAGSTAWGNVSAAVWVAGPVALVASAGTYPIDYTQGYPGGRFASVALRIARRPGGRGASSSVDSSVAARFFGSSPTGPMVTFAIGQSPDRRHRAIYVRAPAARVVEVTGDFTAWQPVRLARRADGRWTVTLPIAAGIHEIALRIDGGPWMAPPGLTAVRDEFGGMAGILSITP